MGGASSSTMVNLTASAGQDRYALKKQEYLDILKARGVTLDGNIQYKINMYGHHITSDRATIKMPNGHSLALELPWFAMSREGSPWFPPGQNEGKVTYEGRQKLQGAGLLTEHVQGELQLPASGPAHSLGQALRGVYHTIYNTIYDTFLKP